MKKKSNKTTKSVNERMVKDLESLIARYRLVVWNPITNSIDTPERVVVNGESIQLNLNAFDCSIDRILRDASL